jgi:hypothetical protein
MKATIAVMTVLLLLLSCSLSPVLAAKGDLVGHRGLVAAYKPYIVSPQNNHVYSSDSLMLNVSFKAMAYANMNYSASYSLDGQAKVTFPVVKHYVGNWVIYHGENDYVDGSAKLPALSDGSHTLTLFLTLDWEIGYQNGTAVYTYYDSETVNFSIGQAIAPEQTVAEQPTAEPFGYDELSGSIIVTAPVGNFTYSDSDIVVNASLHIGGHEYEPNTHYVPYQNVSCVYSLDGSEWQNMTLVSETKSELFPSIPNNFWYSNMRLNYTATLQGVSEGSHQLRIDVKPDSIRTRSISSSQEKPVVYFNVIGQPSTTAPASDSFLPLANALVVSASAGVIAVAAVVYLKKRKR